MSHHKMKSFAALLIVSVGLASAVEDEILCKCPKIYKPVCGSDGVTYDNLCILLCHQIVTPDITAVGFGGCEDQPNLKKLCACPKIVWPLCGSDGITYNSPCHFKCRQHTDKDLTIDHKGRCEEQNLKKNPCTCTREYLPVCGSDGVTYANDCLLKCKQSQSKDLTINHEGVCEDEKLKRNPCICTREFLPVCGSDGVTYPNECLLKCRQNRLRGLTKAHMGQCETLEIESDVCICTLEYDPVCGSDGVSYSNKCHLKCHQKNNNGLDVAYKGECQKGKVKGDTCNCIMELAPVCGSDGITYSNTCALKCQQKYINGLTIDHKGECQMEDLSKGCVCTLEYDPVCGTDGITYLNMCSLECNETSNGGVELEYFGECNKFY